MIASRPIFLIGYRGTGKSTIARLLGERLHRNAIDADALLEERAGKTIRQIFADDGEKAFRDLESAILRELSTSTRSIVATGGGVILREENRQALTAGFVVWLHAPAPVLWQRLNSDHTTHERRPNLAQGGLAEIEEMLHIRTPLYTACADATIDTESLSPEAAADAIALLVNEPTKTDLPRP